MYRSDDGYFSLIVLCFIIGIVSQVIKKILESCRSNWLFRVQIKDTGLKLKVACIFKI